MEWEGNSDERVGWKGTVSSVLETHCCSEQAESHCGKHGLFSLLVGSHSVLGLSNTEKKRADLIFYQLTAQKARRWSVLFSQEGHDNGLLSKWYCTAMAGMERYPNRFSFQDG